MAGTRGAAQENCFTGVRVTFGRSDSQLQRAIKAPVAGVDGFDIINSVRLTAIREVHAAGGFNADGVGDLLIGAYALNREDHEAPNVWVDYGSRSSFESSLDVANLTASQGLTRVSPLSTDQLAAADDSGGTGYADLGLINGYKSAYVFFAAQGMAGPVVDRNTLPAAATMQITNSSDENTVAYLRAAGDLDGDAVDELGIELSSGQAAILYGEADRCLDSVDLATPGSVDVTRLQGGGDKLSVGDSGFAGVLASTQGPAPIARIENDIFADLFAAMDDAARVSLEQINNALSSGTDPGPTATATRSLVKQIRLNAGLRLCRLDRQRITDVP